MPRAFDSDAQPSRLDFTENVTCEVCGEVFEGLFSDYAQSLTFQDMTDPPLGQHTCPCCGHGWCSELTGWTFFSEAG